MTGLYCGQICTGTCPFARVEIEWLGMYCVPMPAKSFRRPVNRDGKEYKAALLRLRAREALISDSGPVGRGAILREGVMPRAIHSPRCRCVSLKSPLPPPPPFGIHRGGNLSTLPSLFPRATIGAAGAVLQNQVVIGLRKQMAN